MYVLQINRTDNPTESRVKDRKRQFRKREMQIDNEHMKRCCLSLPIDNSVST